MIVEGACLFALVGLKALADCDPVEFRRATDLSKRELDEKIELLIQSTRKNDPEKIYLKEAQERLQEIKNIQDDSESQTEVSFLLRQLQAICFQKAQQLSLSFQRTKKNHAFRAGEILWSPPHTIEKIRPSKLAADEYFRLGVMRLLRELPDYSPKFNYRWKDGVLDCLLVPLARGFPPIAVFGKIRLRSEQAKQFTKTLQKYMSLLGSHTIGVVIARSIDQEVPGQLAELEPNIFPFQFDIENNSFIEQQNISRLVELIRNR